MEVPQSNCLFITFIEKEGPFLKLWGQADKRAALYVEQVLLNTAAQLDSGLCIPNLDSLQIGLLCCAKYKDNKYYRARIVSLTYLHNRYIEVNFIDIGNKDNVPITNIRCLDGFETSFISVPPQASSFILAEAVCLRGEWNDAIFNEISNEIRGSQLNFTVIAQVTKHYLVRLFVGANDLALLLISRGLMRHTTLITQEAVLLSMMPRAPLPQTPTQQQSIATYKAFSLEPGSQYPVYVSYVTDGPCNFSVQLKQSEEVLCKLMKDINSMNLTPLEGIPIPGTVCLARCTEDGHICRAVVTNEVDGHFKVFYVDFGNFEVVPLESLYEIPFKCVIPKVMAIRFGLSGVEKSTVTLEMQCAFKQFVDNRLIHMKVMPTTTRTALPRCELWDPATNVSALDVVIQAAAAAYPEHISLNRGFTQPVKISYVFSCNRFYVQLKSKEEELGNLMMEIQGLCRESEAIPPEHLKAGLPCYALYEGDQQWYRSQIIEMIDSGSVKVQYVDYGNEEVVLTTVLRPIEGKQLTVLRPQAVECCLNGYQNMEPELERDNLLEALILEQEFTMKVVEMLNGKALIELIDHANYNVASLLLDKIASTRYQATPMLVQAGNKIEHRKSSQSREPQGRQEFRNREPREDNNENSRDSSWRNDTRNNRQRSDFENDDSNQNSSWRQNNKGFNNRNRRETNFDDEGEGDSFKPKPFKNHDRNRNNFESRNADGDSWKQNRGFDRNRERPSNKDNWEDNKRNNTRSGDWNNDRDNKRDNTRKSDWGNDRDSKRDDNKTIDWSNEVESERKSFSPREKDTFKRNNRDKYNGGGGGGDTWNSESPKSGGFRKKPDFRREGSEVSSSGSEKSFQKGFNRNKGAGNFTKKFDRPPRKQFLPGNNEVPDAAPSSAKFAIQDVNGSEADVTISWFHNPSLFYCQLQNSQDDFKQMMEDIQQAYKDRQPGTAAVGAPVVGLFPEDGVTYRAQILETTGTQYKVHYVDFGNVSTIDKVWAIENRFMALPAQAICCSLYGVEPPTEEWPDVQSYSQYFDKKQFHCRFISTENDKFFVQLEHDSQIIGDLLLGDGLAKSSLPPPVPTIQVPLLLSQQFRAMLMSVNSLDDFAILLQCGVTLTCSVFNLAISTETWVDTLRSHLQQILLVYVDNVTDDDKLEVTLYDGDGNKIKLIDKDEGAYETVELLCPYLILNSTVYGFVTHADDTTIFIQPTDVAENVEYLLNQLFEYYEGAVAENTIVPEEGFVYAVKSSDDNWYRGRVTSFDDEKAAVNFLDYGNSESVQFTALRELAAEFMQLPIMCVPVALSVPTEPLLNADVGVSVEFGDDGLIGTLLQEAEPVEVQQAETLEPQPVEAIEDVPTETPLSQPDGTLVFLSHTDSPSDFYLQLSDSITAIEELQASLQEQVLEMADLENPTIGVLCAAPYSLDQQWYRAQVLDADADITTVRFVDYGNTDVIDNATTQVKTLPPNLLALEVYATRCRLKIKPMEEEWSQAASERFEILTAVDQLTAQFIDQDEKTNYVELFSNGVNIREVLIEENLALPDEVLTESKCNGFVSHLNSPSEFWIQLENCIEELEWVAEQLSGAESFAELEDLAPGTLCAALFPDDLQWYRARILSNTVAGLEVLFVDYGNSCTSCSLRELREDLVMLAPLAQKCSLQKPAGLTTWSPEMIRKFSEISADGQTIFTVKKLSTGETALVELLLDGEDVATMLIPQTQEVCVKRCETLDDIVLVVNGEEVQQRYKLEALPDVVWNQDSVSKFTQIANAGNTVFQAEFVTDDTVRLYIDLNDVRLDLSGTKKTSATSTPIKMRSESKEGEALVNAELHSDEIHSITSIIADIVQNAIVDDEFESSSNSVVTPIVESLLTNATGQDDEVDGTHETQPVLDITTGEKSHNSVVTTILAEIVSDAAQSPDKKAPAETIESTTELVGAIVENNANEAMMSPVKEANTETVDAAEPVESATEIVTSLVANIASEAMKSPVKKVNTESAAAAEPVVSTTEAVSTIVANVVDEAMKSPKKERVTSDVNRLEHGANKNDLEIAAVSSTEACTTENDLSKPESLILSEEKSSTGDDMTNDESELKVENRSRDSDDCDIKLSSSLDDKGSRPGSAASGKIPHDERIVSGMWSRSPSPESD